MPTLPKKIAAKCPMLSAKWDSAKWDSAKWDLAKRAYTMSMTDGRRYSRFAFRRYSRSPITEPF